MVSPQFRNTNSMRSDSGSVMLELFFGIGILFLFSAAVIDFGLGFQNYAGAVNAAHDLARIGARHNPAECSGGEATMSVCELACSKATAILCSYGLNPGSYSVDLHQSTDWPEMLAADVSSTGVGSIFWRFSMLPTASAYFTMEGPLAEAAFNSAGCGACTLGACS